MPASSTCSDFAMASLALNDAVLRTRLLDLYLALDAYPDAVELLEQLKAAEHETAILSNGSPEMLAAAVSSAGIGGLLDAVLSVEEVGIFKPHPAVYQLTVDRLGIEASRIVFLSANAWDASGAAAFGFRAVWINRSGQGREPLPAQPETEITSLAELPALLVR